MLFFGGVVFNFSCFIALSAEGRLLAEPLKAACWLSHLIKVLHFTAVPIVLHFCFLRTYLALTVEHFTVSSKASFFFLLFSLFFNFIRRCVPKMSAAVSCAWEGCPRIAATTPPAFWAVVAITCWSLGQPVWGRSR